MCCSVIDIEFEPGAEGQAKEIMNSHIPEHAKRECNQFILADKSNNPFTVIPIFYDLAKQETGTPTAQELPGRLADIMKTPAERERGNTPVNQTF